MGSAGAHEFGNEFFVCWLRKRKFFIVGLLPTVLSLGFVSAMGCPDRLFRDLTAAMVHDARRPNESGAPARGEQSRSATPQWSRPDCCP